MSEQKTIEKKEKLVTLADVAKRANVAIRTASKVFRNDKTVRVGTKEKVLKVAKELNYTPNALAQALRNKALKIVSFQITQFYNPFFGMLFEYVAEELGRHDYMVVPCNGVDKVNEANQQIFACATILASTEPSKIKEIVQNGPLVSINSSTPMLALASDVSIDFKYAYTDLTEKLVSMDLKNIAFCVPEAEYRPNVEGKLSPVEHTLAAHGLATINTREGIKFYTPHDIVEYLHKHPDGIDAVICSNDIVGVNVINGLIRNGIDFPNSIKVIGSDGTIPAEDMWTIYTDLKIVAEAVVEMLLKAIDKKSAPRQVIFRPELMVGKNNKLTPIKGR